MKKGRKKKNDIENEKKKDDYIGQSIETKIKMEAIDALLNMYPDLKKDKNVIVTTILNQKYNKTEVGKEKIVIEFTHNNKTYYRSKLGEIFDENIELVGTYKVENGVNIYNFFEDLNNEEINLKI